MSYEIIPELRDFRNFIAYVWPALRLARPAEIQFDIARFFQHGAKRRQIRAGRGVGKSWLAAAYCCWRFYLDPDTLIMVVSATKPKARDFVSLVRQMIDVVDILEPLRPGRYDIDGAERFDIGCKTRVSKDPSLAAYGMGSQKTGSHVDVIVADDVESLENSKTQEARREILRGVKEFEDIIEPHGDIIMLGTPQTQDSVYNPLSKLYEMYRWPSEFPPLVADELEDLAPWLLNKLKDGSAQPGDSTYPERFPKEILLEKLAAHGAANYALQYKLSTKLADSDRYPLKLSDLIVMSLPGDVGPWNVLWGSSEPLKEIESPGMGNDRFYGPIHWERRFEAYTGTVMYVDPSGSGKDQTGYAIVSMLNGLLYVRAAGGLDGGVSDATMTKLAREANQYQVKEILVEPNYGGGAHTKLVAAAVGRLGYKISVKDATWSKGQKERRIIETLMPVVQNHRLIVDTRVAKNAELWHQFTHIQPIPKALEHDDQVEALAGAVSYWTSSLEVDSSKAAAAKEKAEMLREAREHAQRVGKAGWLAGTLQGPRQAPGTNDDRRRSIADRFFRRPGLTPGAR